MTKIGYNDICVFSSELECVVCVSLRFPIDFLPTYAVEEIIFVACDHNSISKHIQYIEIRPILWRQHKRSSSGWDKRAMHACTRYSVYGRKMKNFSYGMGFLNTSPAGNDAHMPLSARDING